VLINGNKFQRNIWLYITKRLWPTPWCIKIKLSRKLAVGLKIQGIYLEWCVIWKMQHNFGEWDDVRNASYRGTSTKPWCPVQLTLTLNMLFKLWTPLCNWMSQGVLNTAKAYNINNGTRVNFIQEYVSTTVSRVSIFLYSLQPLCINTVYVNWIT
jgi:hypothetical protein